jgi:hypothetical protein
MSNPLRQSLYTLDDCLNGGEFKATAAVKSLTRIFPAVVSDFYPLASSQKGYTKQMLIFHTVHLFHHSFYRMQKVL